MSREHLLQRRLRTLETLDEAVRALRSLSAQHFRAARSPLEPARAYRRGVEGFRGVLGAGGPPAAGGGPTGIVLIAADLGLVGDYTGRLVSRALELRGAQGPGPLVCLGRRALAPLAKAGVEPVSVQPAPPSVAGLPRLLLPLVDTLLSLHRSGELRSLWLVAARFEGAGDYTPVAVPVLPVAAPPELPPLPLSPYSTPAQLRLVVLRELLYATLYETLLEALASEHGKRLVMAEAARSWLGERIDATRRLARALRREAATQEVLEVASAARRLRRGGPR